MMTRARGFTRLPSGRRPAARAAVFLACLWLVGPAFGAISGRPVGIVLQLEGIEGELRLPKHEGWIRVDRFDWDLANRNGQTSPGTAARSGPGTPPTALSFLKEVEKSSPKIAEAVCNGSVIPRARFEFFTIGGGGNLIRFYQVMLENVLVASCSVEGGGGVVRPMERVSLDFERIEWTYTELSADGKALADHRAFWDFVLNEGGFERLRRGFKVTAGTEIGRNGIRLRWLAEVGCKYRILRSDLVNGQFTQVLPDLDSAGDVEQELWLPREGPFGFFIITEVDSSGAP